MKVLWVQMIDLYLIYFQICLGTLLWHPNNVGRNEKVMKVAWYHLHSFFALAFENELEYHYLYVHLNSSDNQATSDINFVGF